MGDQTPFSQLLSGSNPNSNQSSIVPNFGFVGYNQPRFSQFHNPNIGALQGGYPPHQYMSFQPHSGYPSHQYTSYPSQGGYPPLQYTSFPPAPNTQSSGMSTEAPFVPPSSSKKKRKKVVDSSPPGPLLAIHRWSQSEKKVLF